MKEIFEEIPGYENLYKISNTGKIWSVLKKRFLNPKPTKYGYIRVDLTDSNKVEKSLALHRLVAIVFVKNPDNKPFVNHINGVKTDNRSENLEWCTCKENIIHAFKTGLKTGVRGEKNNLTKLTKEDVLKIRELYPEVSLKKLAIMFSTSISNVYHIINRSTWNHI